MNETSSPLARLLLGTATALALSFGTAQAFAAPAAVENARLACEPFTCEQKCIAAGHDTGICTWRGCQCYDAIGVAR